MITVKAIRMLALHYNDTFNINCGPLEIVVGSNKIQKNYSIDLVSCASFIEAGHFIVENIMFTSIDGKTFEFFVYLEDELILTKRKITYSAQVIV